jgi:hypothetical protein
MIGTNPEFVRVVIDPRAKRRENLHVLIDKWDDEDYHGKVIISYFGGEIRHVTTDHSIDLDTPNVNPG